MEAAAPEQPNEAGLAAFSERADEAAPVTMLNLLLGEQSWDMVLLVEYPSRRAFLEMIGSEAYQAIAHLRTGALTRGELHPLASVELPV